MQRRRVLTAAFGIASAILVAWLLAPLIFGSDEDGGSKPQSDEGMVSRESSIAPTPPAAPAAEVRRSERSAGPADAGQEAAPVLDPDRDLRGVVVDEDGRPMPGASVSLERPDDGRRVTYDLARADGSFRLGGLEPGAYRLVADSGFHRSLAADGRRRRYGEARMDDVVAGTDGLRIVLPEALETTGVVVGPDGEPVPHAFFYRKRDGRYLWVTKADDGGRFTLWRTLDEGTSLRCYPGRGGERNPWAWRLKENGAADLRWEHVVPDVQAGARDLVVRLPKLPSQD